MSNPWQWTIAQLANKPLAARALLTKSQKLKGKPNVRIWKPTQKQVATMTRAQLTPAQLAAEFKVTVKTIYAWYRRNSTAYRSTRSSNGLAH